MSNTNKDQINKENIGLSWIIQRLVVLLQRLAGILLLGMMFITCSDVVGNLFAYPILGSEEIVSLLAAVLLAFSLPAAHCNRAHIGIDLLYRILSPGKRRINDLFISLISAVFFGVTAWQCFLYAQDLYKSGEVSSTLQLPIYLILYAISISCFLLFLIALQELWQRWRNY